MTAHIVTELLDNIKLVDDIELVDIDNESNIDTILDEIAENSDISEYEDISSQEQEEQKELFRQKVEFFNKNLITIFMEGDDLFSAVVDKLVSLYSQSKESIDANIPKGVDAIKYMVAKKVTQILLGDGFEIRQIDARQDNLKQEIDQHSTEAALQRIEDLKRKYTSEQIIEMRKLRAEVEEMLTEIEQIDKNDKVALENILSRYKITKFQGRRVHGDPIAFVLNPKFGYSRFLNVLFKAEARRIDKLLINAIRDVSCGRSDKDPFLTEDKKTEMYAAGLLGDIKQKEIARIAIQVRQPMRERLHSLAI